MLQVNPEIVCRLIELAQSFHVREQTSIPDEGSNAADDWSQQMLADALQDGLEQHGYSCQELNSRPPM